MTLSALVQQPHSAFSPHRTKNSLLLDHQLAKNSLSLAENSTQKTELSSLSLPMMRRFSSSTSPTPIQEGMASQGGNNNNMITASTVNTAPAAPSHMNSNLTELWLRSQKAMPNSTSMMIFQQQQQQQLASQQLQQANAMDFCFACNATTNNNLASSLDYSTAFAAAVAAGRTPSMFQNQGIGSMGQGNSAEMMFLLEQQQQQQQRARWSAAERLSAVDGGNSFLQERLGMSGNNMSGMQASSMMMNTPQSSPSLYSNSNPQLDLAQVLMASQQQRNAFGNAGSAFGMVPPSQNASDLSRMIMMLRGQGNCGSARGGGGCGALNTNNNGPSLSSFVGSAAALKSPESDKKRPATAALPKKKRTPKKPKISKPKPPMIRAEVTVQRRDMPCVLYTEDDDDYLTPYQCLLRKQLEIFVADPEDVRCSSQQGRTTNIQVGQVGLRCKWCEGGLASRTKGAVYYSHSVDGIYQVGQNIGKVHLAERCYRVPDEVRRQLIALRNDSRRASSGKAYWSDRIRGLGVYEDGSILKMRIASEAEAAKEGSGNGSAAVVTATTESTDGSIKTESAESTAAKKPAAVAAENASQKQAIKDASSVAVTRQE